MYIYKHIAIGLWHHGETLFCCYLVVHVHACMYIEIGLWDHGEILLCHSWLTQKDPMSSACFQILHGSSDTVCFLCVFSTIKTLCATKYIQWNSFITGSEEHSAWIHVCSNKTCGNGNVFECCWWTAKSRWHSAGELCTCMWTVMSEMIPRVTYGNMFSVIMSVQKYVVDLYFVTLCLSMKVVVRPQTLFFPAFHSKLHTFRPNSDVPAYSDIWNSGNH